MRQNIEVLSFTEVKTAQSQRKYWTLQNTEQKTFVCFIIPLREHCHIGQTIDAEVEPSLKEGDSSRLVNIYIDGKPIYQDEKKFTGRTFGKSDKELAQQRGIEEDKRKSIEAQVALKSAVDLAISNECLDISEIEKNTRQLYQLLQSLTQEVKITGEVKLEKKPSIAKTEPDKKTEISKEVSVNETGQETTGKPIIETAKDLMDWAKKHNKYPSWVRQTAKLGDQIISDEMAAKAYRELKEITGWD